MEAKAKAARIKPYASPSDKAIAKNFFEVEGAPKYVKGGPRVTRHEAGYRYGAEKQRVFRQMKDYGYTDTKALQVRKEQYNAVVAQQKLAGLYHQADEMLALTKEMEALGLCPEC
jgi:hypothetical protein